MNHGLFLKRHPLRRQVSHEAPALAFIAIFTLAVGIGANSAIFSAVNALLIDPLRFPEPDRILAIWETQPSRGVVRNEASMANYLDWRSQNQTFEKNGSLSLVERESHRLGHS